MSNLAGPAAGTASAAAAPAINMNNGSNTECHHRLFDIEEMIKMEDEQSHKAKLADNTVCHSHRQIPSFGSDYSIQEPVTPPYVNGPAVSNSSGPFNTGFGTFGPKFDGPDGFFADWLQYHQEQQQLHQNYHNRLQQSHTINSNVHNVKTSTNQSAATPPSSFLTNLFTPGKFTNANSNYTFNDYSSSFSTSANFVPTSSTQQEPEMSENQLIGDIVRLQIGSTSPLSRFDGIDLNSASNSGMVSPGDAVPRSSTRPPSPRKSSFLQAETTDDKFPILVRRDSRGFAMNGSHYRHLSHPIIGTNKSMLMSSATSGSSPIALQLSGSGAATSGGSGANTSAAVASPPAISNEAMTGIVNVGGRLPSSSSLPSTKASNISNINEATCGTIGPTGARRQTTTSLLSNKQQQEHQQQQQVNKPGLTGKAGSSICTNNGHSSSSSNSSLGSAPSAPSSGNRIRRKRSEDVSYANADIEALSENIYSLCKDQHGCRFLQKKLDENNPQHIELIFSRTYSHIAELMTDPFGNYLCQKLLDHVDVQQQTVLIKYVSQDLVKIALNQHGTRALQKMIQSIVNTEQTDMVIEALRENVVNLILDLNGNHVIQRCLNKFSSDGCQFIYDAVANHCVRIAKHKHGCCVFQRCIDFASEDQKKQLVAVITENALELVQDQFGNYVAQYVLDLGRQEFNEPLINRFNGNICNLSVQKFSSNVIEKCLRIASPTNQEYMIEELINTQSLEMLLRDSYANYVIQTALECASPMLRANLVDKIRPILPSIRSTPYGRRIHSKIGNC